MSSSFEDGGADEQIRSKIDEQVRWYMRERYACRLKLCAVAQLVGSGAYGFGPPGCCRVRVRAVRGRQRAGVRRGAHVPPAAAALALRRVRRRAAERGARGRRAPRAGAAGPRRAPEIDRARPPAAVRLPHGAARAAAAARALRRRCHPVVARHLGGERARRNAGERVDGGAAPRRPRTRAAARPRRRQATRRTRWAARRRPTVPLERWRSESDLRGAAARYVDQHVC